MHAPDVMSGALLFPRPGAFLDERKKFSIQFHGAVWA
jgi:hypothetical protein